MKGQFLAISVITILFVGSYFVSDSFAVDFRDSTGYTPSWAKGSGYHSVLLQCTELIGDYSRDGDWCLEWTAYVLDQGVENFPQSTQGTGYTSIANPQSERNCVENKICAFPGEYLRYKVWDSFDNFEEIAVVEFKEKINSDNIRFFSDGFGSKPLTYNLNLKTGIETHDEYSGVNRPFNFLEPIPMKLNQNVFRAFGDYYEAKITNEKIADLGEIGLSFGKRTIMGAEIIGSNGDITVLGYDKETGVLITQMEKYHFDNQEFISGVLLIDTNILSVPTTITSTKTSGDTNEQSFSYTFTDSNYEQNKSKITITPVTGSGSPGCEGTANGCYIPKTATVNIGGVVIMSNTDNVAHTYTSGTPANGPDGKFDTSLLMAGSSFEWTPDTIGEYPYFCMVHPWMVGSITVIQDTSKTSETITTQNQQTKEEKDEKIQTINEQRTTTSDTTNSENESNAGNIAIGVFVVFGIPAILIGLFIARRKMKKSKEQKIRDSEWKGV